MKPKKLSRKNNTNKKIKENYKFLKNCKCNKNSIELKILKLFFSKLKKQKLKQKLKKRNFRDKEI